jgi:hypothetical protein
MLLPIDLHENLIDEEGVAESRESMTLIGIRPPILSILAI